MQRKPTDKDQRRQELPFGRISDVSTADLSKPKSSGTRPPLAFHRRFAALQTIGEIAVGGDAEVGQLDSDGARECVRPDTGKCLHYYFYFIDAELGLIYLRVPTWCPFRLQFYCNGHSWLARQLTAAGIDFTLADNAFLRIDDWERADPCQWPLARPAASRPRSLRPAVLSGA